MPSFDPPVFHLHILYSNILIIKQITPVLASIIFISMRFSVSWEPSTFIKRYKILPLLTVMNTRAVRRSTIGSLTAIVKYLNLQHWSPFKHASFASYSQPVCHNMNHQMIFPALRVGRVFGYSFALFCVQGGFKK